MVQVKGRRGEKVDVGLAADEETGGLEEAGSTRAGRGIRCLGKWEKDCLAGTEGRPATRGGGDGEGGDGDLSRESADECYLWSRNG